MKLSDEADLSVGLCSLLQTSLVIFVSIVYVISSDFMLKYSG